MNEFLNSPVTVRMLIAAIIGVWIADKIADLVFG